jgi:drug/metabolite transporter (DMT)-like permease
MTLSPFFFVFLAPALYGVANILDTFLAGKLFRQTSALIFYSELLNILFIPLVWLFEKPVLPGWDMVPLFLAIGACDVLYLYPYFQALREDDTAIVSSLFALGKVCVPILAFFIVGETLTLRTYVGFGLIIISSALLTLTVRGGSLKLRPSFFYMGIASLIISLELVLYKYLLGNVSWSTGFVSSTVAAFGLSFFMLVVPAWRRSIMAGWKTFSQRFHFLVLGEFLTIGASGSYTYATSALPATVVGGVGEVQPFIVLLYALLFSRFWPKAFKERIDARTVMRKFALFALTLTGVFLILY